MITAPVFLQYTGVKCVVRVPVSDEDVIGAMDLRVDSLSVGRDSLFERGPRWWVNLSGFGLAVAPKLGDERICQDVDFSIGNLPACVAQIGQPNLSPARHWCNIEDWSLGPRRTRSKGHGEKSDISREHVDLQQKKSN